jgi:hypothetical protein
MPMEDVMSDAADFSNFLKSDPAIGAINFQFSTYKVYPGGYRTDIADLVANGKIKINRRFSDIGMADTGASYMPDSDHFSISHGFDIAKDVPKLLFVHEATHALLDWQKVGTIPTTDSEAVAYLAEAIFVHTKGWKALGGVGGTPPPRLRVEAYRVAGVVVGGAYTVPPGDAAALIAAVRATPLYADKLTSFTRYDGIS